MEVAVGSLTSATTGASLRQPIAWHSINWAKVNRTVRRLQVRIVKAIQAGKPRKARALQYILARSFSGKALAVRRVTENRGKQTAGVDGETWSTPPQKAAAISRLKTKGYTPKPLLRIYIPKSDGKRLRPLSIPVMVDRAMQALHLLTLDPIVETWADPNSYGFRIARSTADAIGQCFISLKNPTSPQWVLEGDIKACFDELSQKWLEANVPMNKAILHKWLTAGYMEQNQVYPTEKGAPQGGIASPALANLALDGLEKRLRDKFGASSRARNKTQINLIRYADDFVITGISKELLENEVKPVVEQFLAERGLELSPEKTVVTHINDGFDFLGQNIRKYNGKLIIKPAAKNVKAFLTKVRHIINSNKQATAGNLILQLNPLIRGWANYHRHVCSSDTFSKVDNAIFVALWRWAKRRHSNKSGSWVKQKYFPAIGRRQWVFSGQATGTAGEQRRICLIKATRTPIKRHIKIRAEANPYDPAWEPYFEKRLADKMSDTLKGQNQIWQMWQRQNGICPVCQQAITEQTGWHQHHLVWRVNGGSDALDNRVLLHPNCHRQVHSHGISVELLRPSPGV
jgi:RNA-directed DNA polymerase